ncbi:MAG: hypothetical protein FWD54_01525 [Endomicrobia bacterium]|nr:hypothetical protein [Endomicrobiia bacterium]
MKKLICLLLCICFSFILLHNKSGDVVVDPEEILYVVPIRSGGSVIVFKVHGNSVSVTEDVQEVFQKINQANNLKT